MNLHQQLSDLLAAIQSLTTGKLPPLLLSRTMLRSTLDSIQQSFIDSHHEYRIIHQDVFWYYKHCTYIYLRKGTNLYVTIQIPLTTFQNPFDIFIISAFPLIMPQEPNHVMQLTTLPEAIAIEQGTAAYWYTLSANQVRDLDQRHYSNRQRLFNSAERPSCVISLFKGHRLDVDQN